MIVTTAELKKIIMEQLNNQPQVESVEFLDLKQLSKTINLHGKITASGHDIEFSGDLQNNEDGIELGNTEINAGFFVKAIIRPYLKKVPALIRKHLEKYYKKKFDSINITSKGLNLNE